LTQFDVVILGAGAAGMMCALTAGRRGRRVLLLDHADAPGKKILISGGGRCNFTNIHTAPDRFFSANPHFCKSALSRYTPQDFLAIVHSHGIAWHEKTLGQLFCDGSARAIVAMLVAECAAVGVEIRLAQRVTDISRTDRFRVQTAQDGISAESLVLATGGLSIPKMGATGFALDVARRFDLPVVETLPALVPLTFAPAELARTQKLSGVSLDVVARCGGRSFREAMLFTHRGLSGPAILQISTCWRDGQTVELDLLPEAQPAFLQQRKRARPKAGLRALLAEALPHRVADVFLPEDLSARKIGELADTALARLGAGLKAWQVNPSGTEGYAKAEVMQGGVDTSALSSQTMQAKTVPGLFVVGEAVDVTGWLGGYNFQWAWASGWCAGMAA
jgi:hypothetical protein